MCLGQLAWIRWSVRWHLAVQRAACLQRSVQHPTMPSSCSGANGRLLRFAKSRVRSRTRTERSGETRSSPVVLLVRSTLGRGSDPARERKWSKPSKKFRVGCPSALGPLLGGRFCSQGERQARCKRTYIRATCSFFSACCTRARRRISPVYSCTTLNRLFRTRARYVRNFCAAQIPRASRHAMAALKRL